MARISFLDTSPRPSMAPRPDEAVRKRPADLDGSGASRASGSGVDHGADSLGEPARVAGGVGDGFLSDALSLAPVAPEQDRWISAPVRDFVDSVCHGNWLSEPESTYNRQDEIKIS